jgi:hypothetical protein
MFRRVALVRTGVSEERIATMMQEIRSSENSVLIPGDGIDSANNILNLDSSVIQPVA